MFMPNVLILNRPHVTFLYTNYKERQRKESYATAAEEPGLKKTVARSKKEKKKTLYLV